MNTQDKITQTTDIPQELIFVKYKLSTKGPYSVTYRGYEYSLLLDELTERDKLFMLCSICEGVMVEATLCGGKFTCHLCVPTGSDAIPVLPTRKTISELSSCCPLHLRGCKWVGTLATVLNHMEKCDYLFTVCPLGCSEVMLQKSIPEHKNVDCNERTISCDLCCVPIIAKCLPEHLDVCPKFTIQCNQCQEQLFRKDLSDHNSNICLHRPVECRYAKYGCRENLVYFQLNQHILENNEVHITLLESSHKLIETNFHTLESSYTRLETDFRGFESSYKRFHELKSSNECLKEDLCERNTQILNLLWQREITDVHGNIFINLPHMCKRLHTVCQPHKCGVTLKFVNENFYLNIIKEFNNRLYFIISFPYHREGFVTTYLINQENTKDSIVFRNKELRCKPQLQFPFKSPGEESNNSESKPIPSYSVISTGLEVSLLQPPFLLNDVFILRIFLSLSCSK